MRMQNFGSGSIESWLMKKKSYKMNFLSPKTNVHLNFMKQIAQKLCKNNSTSMFLKIV